MNMRPEAKTETLTIRISTEVKERIVKRAIKEKRTFASESEYLIEKALDVLDAPLPGQARELQEALEGQK